MIRARRCTRWPICAGHVQLSFSLLFFVPPDPLTASNKHHIQSIPIKHGDIKLGDMLPKTKEMLREFYSPHNKQLATLLRDPNFRWGY